jgi:hypothetical protein
MPQNLPRKPRRFEFWLYQFVLGSLGIISVGRGDAALAVLSLALMIVVAFVAARDDEFR